MVGFLEMVTVAERKSQQVSVWGQEETGSGVVQQQSQQGTFGKGKTAASWLARREGKRYTLRSEGHGLDREAVENQEALAFCLNV